MRIFSVIFVLVSFCVHATERSLSIVIVGGGPAGLATAIEALEMGADVTIVEQRDAYTRTQLLFLFEPALDLLKKWDVSTPTMVIAELDKNQKVGVVEIRELEYALANRTKELNITLIHGKFTQVNPSSIEIIADNVPIELPYDILVGADGVHSLVREEMNIPCICCGKTTAAAMFIPLACAPGKAEIPAAKPFQDLYFKRILIPFGRIIMTQGTLSSFNASRDVAGPEIFEEVARESGWIEEADLIAAGQSIPTGTISVVLQQAMTFSDISKSIILVGDAAAAAPFFQGRGANYTFKTAAIAGSFFKRVQQEKTAAFRDFNDEIQCATDELIQDSEYLMR